MYSVAGNDPIWLITMPAFHSVVSSFALAGCRLFSVFSGSVVHDFGLAPNRQAMVFHFGPWPASHSARVHLVPNDVSNLLE